MRINPIHPSVRTKKRSKPNDKAFLAWIRKQPSAISGKTPCVAAHYRTASNSGIGIKPMYSAIPLTYSEHCYQHRIGQYAFMPRDEWEMLVSYYVKKYNEETDTKGIY